jgi:ketosteroid isomerase-like protein
VLPVFVEQSATRIPGAEATRTPAAGGFSLLEHVCHLRDYDEEGCIGRIAQMLAEDTPFLPDFAGEKIARERDYRRQDLASSVDAFLRNRARLLDMVDSLSSTDMARTGRLGSAGVVSVARLLELVADHDDTHRLEIDALVHELDVEYLRSMARAFSEAFNAGDVDALMRFYGDTYVDVNLRQPVQSHAERLAYYARLIQRGGTRLAVRPDEIMIEGTVAFVRGRIELRRTAPGENAASIVELRYLEVARKGVNGSWIAVWGMDGPIQDA